eukprot:CAMPEP_0198588432 /NCGR_PEP_ID=MMETSP1462-20131121/133130_1 /TAXON_ID=1333877 /ORGANISM="Brandtodinium nutriculum, Strain RCC3387" /LENGTH=45 /DNA_ID= /DNA_START= /DNA_END= /DNA_ORIENTATION=
MTPSWLYTKSVDSLGNAAPNAASYFMLILEAFLSNALVALFIIAR